MWLLVCICHGSNYHMNTNLTPSTRPRRTGLDNKLVLQGWLSAAGTPWEPRRLGFSLFRGALCRVLFGLQQSAEHT